MSTSTFLGTPLSKYEIDDIETDLRHKRAQEFEKSKGLQYRQNRERIKRNELKTHYTVDTKEGFVPRNFKSSKSNRATYTQQNVSSFTDLEDADIISKGTLQAIKIDRASLQRNVASILNALGFMGKKRFIGPVNVNTATVKVSNSLEGIGFALDVDKGVEKIQFVKAKDSTNDASSYGGSSSCNAREGASDATVGGVGATAGGAVTRHTNDRQFDLSEIQLYYKHFYSLIVKSVEAKEDLVEKIAKGIEFTAERGVAEKVVETGRRVEAYTFDDELLHRFKIKTQRARTGDARDGGDSKSAGAEFTAGPRLPAELFHSIFG